MQYSDYLERSIQSGDLTEVRGALIGILEADPSFRNGTFRSALGYAEKAVGGEQLYEAFDGDAPERNKDKWNEEYFLIQKVKLRNNFSRERINHLEEVGKSLYAAKSSDTSGTARTTNMGTTYAGGTGSQRGGSQRNKHNEDQRSDPERPRVAILGVVIAVLIVVILMIVLAKAGIFTKIAR